MRLATKHRNEWLTSLHFVEGKQHQIRLNGDWVDVVQVGRGDPLVLIPGLAGGWKLLAPLAEKLAPHFEVTIAGLRGDRFPLGTTWAREMGDYAHDLASLIDRLGLERPAVFGVSFGGAVALELAAEQPQKLGALIVQGAEGAVRASSLGARRSPGASWNGSPCRATTASSTSSSTSSTAASPNPARSSISWSSGAGRPTRASWHNESACSNRSTSPTASGGSTCRPSSWPGPAMRSSR